MPKVPSSQKSKTVKHRANFEAKIRLSGGASVITIPKDIQENWRLTHGKYRIYIEVEPLDDLGFPIQK